MHSLDEKEFTNTALLLLLTITISWWVYPYPRKQNTTTTTTTSPYKPFRVVIVGAGAIRTIAQLRMSKSQRINKRILLVGRDS
jgi:hypothetical protein